MVTFQEIPDEIEQPKKKEEIKDEKEVIQKPPEPTKDELYGVEGQLRKAEQIQVSLNEFSSDFLKTSFSPTEMQPEHNAKKAPEF